MKRIFVYEILYLGKNMRKTNNCSLYLGYQGMNGKAG